MDEMRAEDARKNFADLLNGVQWQGEHVTITRHGRPAAVVVPIDWYEGHQEAKDSE